MTAAKHIVQVDLTDVDNFTRQFLEELQFGQGVALVRATPTTSTWRWPGRSAST